MRPFQSPLLALVLTGACLGQAQAADAARCQVSIDYLLNGVLTAPYTMAFQVGVGQPFEDDFSTPTRLKVFSAQYNNSGPRPGVDIQYFNDVGVFNAIDLRTSVTLRGSAVQTSSGTHTFSTTQGTVGDHQTRYSLRCRPV